MVVWKLISTWIVSITTTPNDGKQIKRKRQTSNLWGECERYRECECECEWKWEYIGANGVRSVKQNRAKLIKRQWKWRAHNANTRDPKTNMNNIRWMNQTCMRHECVQRLESIYNSLSFMLLHSNHEQKRSIMHILFYLLKNFVCRVLSFVFGFILFFSLCVDVFCVSFLNAQRLWS